MHERDRRVGRPGALHAAEFTGDDAQQSAAVGGGGQADLARAQVLVARGSELQVRRQVDPQLKAVEEATAHDQVLRWLLDVEDACAGRHPLRVAVGDDAATAMGVSVLEDAVDDVGDGLEAAVRMPRSALGLAGSVFDLAHLVHHDEGIEGAKIDAGERAAHREAFTLEAARCRGERHDGARDRGRVRCLDARQAQRVVDGDRRHLISPCTGAARGEDPVRQVVER